MCVCVCAAHRVRRKRDIYDCDNNKVARQRQSKNKSSTLRKTFFEGGKKSCPRWDSNHELFFRGEPYYILYAICKLHKVFYLNCMIHVYLSLQQNRYRASWHCRGPLLWSSCHSQLSPPSYLHISNISTISLYLH